MVDQRQSGGHNGKRPPGPGGGNKPERQGGKSRRRRRSGRGGEGNGPGNGERDQTKNQKANRGEHRDHNSRPRKGGGGAQEPTRRRPEPEVPEAPFVHTFKTYGLAMYDTLAQAKADLETLAQEAKRFDQLNIVIRADANMEDPELMALGNVKIFAGAAWSLIHERRRDEGWYSEPR